jgi:opacity protein-like surface antigen
MKNLMSTAAMLTAMTAGTASQAQGFGDQWYVSVFAGYANIGSIDTDFYVDDVEHEFDDSYTLGLTVGTTLGTNLRGEVELSYSRYEGGDVNYTGYFGDSTSSSDGDAATTFLLANIWYDLPNASVGGGTPYLGGGIGAVSLDVETTFDGNPFGYGDTVTGLGYQIGAGIQFPMGAGLIDVAYRLKGTNGLDIDDNDDAGDVYKDGTFLSNNLQVGYVMKF